MLELGLPILFATLLWWFSTGAILYLDGLRRSTYRASMACATCVGLVALVAIWWTRHDTTPMGAYAGFVAALLVWGWNEMAFLMGFITGPRRVPASGSISGWARFGEASATVISHELAIVATGLVILAISWDATNAVALWTFVILWLMRLSAKFNIFLGAPNVTDEFLPAHLSYLTSYFRRRPMNGFFPVAVTLATLVTAWLAHKALWSSGDPYGMTANSLLAGLMALAVLEHWLMFIPLPSSWLWRWSLKNRTDPPLRGTADLTTTGLPGRST